MKPNETRTWHGEWETIGLAIVLMITGFVLLGGDFVGMFSLDRIQNFWPVAIIAIGLAELPSSGVTR